MPGTNETVDLVRNLVETCRDGQNGYLHAAAQVSDPNLKTYFDDQSLERGRFAVELQAASKALGDVSGNETGTVAGVVHRAWFEFKGDMGANDHEILVSVEQGEDYARRAYEEALKASLPERILDLIAEQYANVREAHDRVRGWRNANSTAAIHADLQGKQTRAA